MLTATQQKKCQPGVTMLAQPVLPLVRLAGMLFLTGPFQTMAEVVAELLAEVETNNLVYPSPQTTLAPFLQAMAPYERLKIPQPPARIILSAQGEEVEPLAAIDSWVAQNVLQQELEAINSQLCGPCGCRLCCVGPQPDMTQSFFEIPLQDREIASFPEPHINTNHSRATTSNAEDPLMVQGKRFYHISKPQLIHWQQGWSLILSTGTSCPNLDQASGGCTIYSHRPEVCRRPQIFPYALERLPSHDSEYEGRTLPAYRQRASILAIWDCPYVQQFQEEIDRYAQLCEMAIIFKENKA